MTRAIVIAITVCCSTAFALQCQAQTAVGTQPASEGPSQGPSQGPPAELIGWVKGQAIALDTIEPGAGAADLKALDALVGDARIVLMGDSRHDAREQWLLKHRIIEYLVKNLGFSVLALEESLPCTSALNECLLGKRDDLGAALSALGGWYLYDTEEMLAIMSMLRAHNADTATDRPVQADTTDRPVPVDTQINPVRVYGIDVSDGARRGVHKALAYLAEADTAAADRLRRAIDISPFGKYFWMQTIQNYGELTPGATDSLGAGLADLVNTLNERRDELIASSGEAEYEWALRHAIVAIRVHEMMLAFKAGSFLAGGNVREAAMVENLKWLLDVAAPGEKFIIWAHNFHVAREPMYVEIPQRPQMTIDPLGHLLVDELDDPTVTIGFSFERGVESSGLKPAPEDWVDGVMAKAGPDAFLLDLRAAPEDGPVHDWLHADQTMRGEGGKAVLAPAKAFDIIAFVREVGPVTRSETARARFGGSQ
jgi:erythromycin esterase